IHIVLCKIHRGLIHTNVDVVGHRQTNGVIERQHKFPVDDMFLKSLRSRQRYGWRNPRRNTQDALTKIGLLSKRSGRTCQRDKHHQHQRSDVTHAWPPHCLDSEENSTYSYRIASTGSSRTAVIAGSLPNTTPTEIVTIYS